MMYYLIEIYQLIVELWYHAHCFSEWRKTILDPEYSMFMCDCVFVAILALNCGLPIEHVNAYCDDSDVDPWLFLCVLF